MEAINETLDQLITNADAMKKAALEPALFQEMKALHKTQESLLARLIDRHNMVEHKKEVGRPHKKLHNKITSLSRRQIRNRLMNQ